MRIFVILFFVVVGTFGLNGQMIEHDGTAKFGNEWIDYNKEYYKIPIAEDGIYHISYSQLSNAGIDMSGKNGKDFQLFAYGKEVSVYTSTEGQFGSNDYIEFYGEKNRSQLDYYLYRVKQNMFNPEYSLFTDTSAYYLTWDKTTSNKRFTLVDNDLSGTLPPVEEYYWHEEKQVFYSHNNKPVREGDNHVQYSYFDVGEGFGTKVQVTNSFTINTQDFLNVGEKPKLKLRYATNGGMHRIEVHLNNERVKTISKNGFICDNFQYSIPIVDLRPQMNISVIGTENSDLKDRIGISVASLIYSRQFNFLNKPYFKFNIESSVFNRYYEISNFDFSGNDIVLYDIVNNTRLIPEIDNDKVKFFLESSDVNQTFVLINRSKSIKNVTSINKVEFTDYSQAIDNNYIIISDKNGFIDDNGKNWVEEYADYRSSVVGGSFNTLIVDINDIYENFGYGINNHSQAINNFIIYIKENFLNPEYIFIIGKGLEYPKIRTKEQLEDDKNLFFVPTFGYPGSDNLLASRYNSDNPEIAIGRIAVKNYTQIGQYLDKVKHQEDYLQYAQTIEDKEWMKKVIHLVGGNSESLVSSIRSSLRIMGYIIKNNEYGGYVETYERTSGTAQESVTEKITNSIKEGAGIITFYGHSSVVGSDFNIAQLDNDKFPVFYSFGCYSGNIHTNGSNGQSERFILNDNGVIVYAGTSGTGFTGALAKLGRNIYSNTGELYGIGLGKIIKKSIEELGNSTGADVVTLKQQFTFHGDPAIVLYKHSGPDFLVDYSTVNTLPAIIQSNSDKFSINFDVVNIGTGISDSLRIKLIRTLPTGKMDTIYTKIKSPGARETVTIDLPTHKIDGIGENCISVYLDPFDNIAELPAPDAEENNQFSNQNGENSYCFHIINNGAKPIYPEEFSITNKQDLELQASTYTYFVENQKYIIQIDTTELFNSPSLKETKINSTGGLIGWKPDIDFIHNTVYYWRISPDSISSSSPYIWQNSSFVFLQNTPDGWNQSHYYQYLKDEPQGILIDNNRKFVYDAKYLGVEISEKIYNQSQPKIVKVNGEYWNSLNPINKRPCIAIASLGLKGFDVGMGNYGNEPGTVNYMYCFKMKKKEQRIGIKDLLNDLPDSSIIFIYTLLGDENQSLYPELWGQDSLTVGYNIFSVLESYGAKKIRLMETKGTVPYVLVFKKGSGVINEQIGKTINNEFTVDFIAPVSKTSGDFSSVVIGPAKEWNKVIWKESDKLSHDNSYLKIYKSTGDLTQFTIVDSLISIYDYDISGIDSEAFPYLKLELFSEDKVDRTPTKLDSWRVLYRGFPDGVLVNNDAAYFYKDTLDYGDIFKFKTNVYNNTSSDMDSLLVKFKIRKQNNEEIVIHKRYKPLLANSSFDISLEYPSNNLRGINEFSVEINPNKEQEEKYYFNNSGTKRFFVRTDSENPMMDVTFNGVHIMDGDIITPKSEIIVKVMDNNEHLLLNDIKMFSKFIIVTPSEKTITIDVENDPEITFEPAVSIDKNEAILRYNHFFNEEGEYQLIVQATDASGNPSGENDYKISFLVILKEQISNVYNYPNPFSTKTQFIYDLTGVNSPEDITIKIMTLSGKIVRELTSVDLGDLSIGNKKTTNYWDGTDEYGRKLANGIYLYKVTVVNSKGEEYKLLKKGENDKKYFKEGFGKLVILR